MAGSLAVSNLTAERSVIILSGSGRARRYSRACRKSFRRTIDDGTDDLVSVVVSERVPPPKHHLESLLTWWILPFPALAELANLLFKGNRRATGLMARRVAAAAKVGRDALAKEEMPLPPQR